MNDEPAFIVVVARPVVLLQRYIIAFPPLSDSAKASGLQKSAWHGAKGPIEPLREFSGNN
jgi:hypothetical protein